MYSLQVLMHQQTTANLSSVTFYINLSTHRTLKNEQLEEGQLFPCHVKIFFWVDYILIHFGFSQWTFYGSTDLRIDFCLFFVNCFDCASSFSFRYSHLLQYTHVPYCQYDR